MSVPPSLTSTSSSRQKVNFLFKIFFSILAGLLISFLKLDYIESFLYDMRIRTQATLGLSDIKDPQIAIVLIKKNTVEKFQGYPKFKDHEKFLRQLAKYNPQFTVYEFRIENNNFLDIAGDNQDKTLFSYAALQLNNFYVASSDLELKGEEGSLKLNPPLDKLKLGSALKNPDTILFGKDGVYRRTLLSYQDKTLLHPLIASYYNPEISDISKIKGQFELLGSTQNYIHFHPKGSFPTYSFEEVVDGKIPNDAFKGKIVIVGADTSRSAKDYAQTPYSRDVEAMTAAELQANQFQTLIDNNAPVKVHPFINLFFTLIISILTVYVTLTLTPSQGLIILGSTLFGFTFFNTLIFIFTQYWLDLAHPLLAIFLCYYFFIPYRLIKENRRSWEYYQKHKLLSQVEELKTNFISMMSHDLKTPIARIQGMAEVISKDPQPLSNNQRDAIDTIKSSADDLLKFINAILQYGRIESQGIELRKQSKDVNALLAEVIKKHEFLAKVKRIKINSQFEPLFPIAIDPDLLKQVFSNLLENAIKYSPEESTVSVSSREENDHVIVEFIDQGMGIESSDLPNLFMKFYRTQNVKTSTIKGSGLGLYLAKYFVELHQGSIKVTSELQKGSQFIVKLPLS